MQNTKYRYDKAQARFKSTRSLVRDDAHLRSIKHKKTCNPYKKAGVIMSGAKNLKRFLRITL
jgi:hypothetical protein